jgi:hypothetical protein
MPKKAGRNSQCVTVADQGTTPASTNGGNRAERKTAIAFDIAGFHARQVWLSKLLSNEH